MSLDKATVAHVAELCRIKVPEAELEPMAAQLNNILGWVEQLNELDTDAVPPMTRVVEIGLMMRGDVVSDGACAGKVLANAPASAQAFFAVPKVIE